MKTSNIILIGFLSLVGLFLLSLLYQFDKDKQHHGIQQAAIALPPFKHLVLLNSADVNLVQAKTDSAIVHFDSKTEALFPKFELKGDTLELSWPNHDGNWGRNINCSGLKTVTVKNSRLNINGFASDSIGIFAEAGEIHVNYNVKFDHISLEIAQKSFAKIKGTVVKSVDAKVKYSYAELHIEQLGELRAELQDSSTLSTWKVLHTDVISEPMSRYYSR
ncbi:MAG TPA: hypothetical protein PLS94_05555 [Prolixibacteraceae bacterium]|nr:hypothetical protein [Prolixibacteraceae bacterium]HPR60304.1 hypothetical protein [Prolixibacteraceae bacterium]